jgi:hypothetical protein
MAAPKRLDHDEQKCAWAIVTEWRQSGDPQHCPRCNAPVLKIVDQSARPHAEWYHLSCAECRLDATLHIPLAAPPPSLD